MNLLRSLIAALIIVPILALSANAQGSYRVRSGDIIRLEVLEDASLNRDILVLPDGHITVPFAGSIHARGRTLSQIQARVASGLAPNFTERPTVFIGLVALVEEEPVEEEEPETIAVYVIGEVPEPGKREIEPGTNLLQFVAEMGGFSRFAATKRIQLRTSRTGTEQVYTLNYDEIERGGGIGSATIMVDGDVIVVPQRRLFE